MQTISGDQYTNAGDEIEARPARCCSQRHRVPNTHTQCQIWYRSYSFESRSTNQNCPFRNPTGRLIETPTVSRSLSRQTLAFDQIRVTGHADTELTDRGSLVRQ